jgi:hypothetical protein
VIRVLIDVTTMMDRGKGLVRYVIVAINGQPPPYGGFYRETEMPSNLPNRGEKYSGPDGPVEVLAVDGVQGTVTVTPAGQPGAEAKVIPLRDWVNGGYAYQPEGGGGPGVPQNATVNDELTQAARRGYAARVRGEPAPQAPQGAVEPKATMTHIPAKIEDQASDEKAKP